MIPGMGEIGETSVVTLQALGSKACSCGKRVSPCRAQEAYIQKYNASCDVYCHRGAGPAVRLFAQKGDLSRAGMDQGDTSG